MAGLDRFQYVYPSVQLQDILKLAQKPASSAISTPYNSLAFNDPLASFMTNENSTQKIMPSQFGLANKPSLQFATPGGDFVQVFGPLKTPGNDKFFHDPNPLVIQRRTRPVTYVQKINLAYYKPPAPPPPGPVIIKEVRPQQAPVPPPLFVRIRPPAPPSHQAPLIIREAPPPPPKRIPPTYLTRVVPFESTPPSNVQAHNALRP